MPPLSGSHPVLSCAEAADFERGYFGADTDREWAAMQAAGKGVALELLRDARTAGIPQLKHASILVMMGKGHNGGDALIAAKWLLHYTRWSVDVGFVFGQNRLRPLALRAWQDLPQGADPERLKAVTLTAVESAYAVVIDGVFGFQFRAPLAGLAHRWLAAANQIKSRLRVAVDLPSGLDEEGAFAADATYATGILKQPLLTSSNAGRKRYVDLGFFEDSASGSIRVLTEQILDPLRRLRRAETDKRSFGLLAVVGGSRNYPGAIGMTVAAALQSGVGNVMAFVPESIAAAFAARWPEAMWVGCPETEAGNLSMESGLLIRRNLQRATALVLGPGLGREPETMALAGDLLRDTRVPTLLDADALQPELVAAGTSPLILTPHQGEFDRIAGGLSAREIGASPNRVLVLKGSVTEIHTAGETYFGLGGGPMLARGGSGDLLAGLIGGRLATSPDTLLKAAAQGVEWHSQAARQVAEIRGETAVRTTALLDQLNAVLRKEMLS